MSWAAMFQKKRAEEKPDKTEILFGLL